MKCVFLWGEKATVHFENYRQINEYQGDIDIGNLNENHTGLLFR